MSQPNGTTVLEWANRKCERALSLCLWRQYDGVENKRPASESASLSLLLQTDVPSSEMGVFFQVIRGKWVAPSHPHIDVLGHVFKWSIFGILGQNPGWIWFLVMHTPSLGQIIQSWEHFFVVGLVKFVPAFAYHFCLNLPATFSQPRTKKCSQLSVITRHASSQHY